MLRRPRISVAATAAALLVLAAALPGALAACGDGILQPAQGESCDDGNTISGCKASKPEVPLDGCLDSCQRPICGDPSRMREWDEATTGRKDVVDVHVRLVSDRLFDFDQQSFEVEILHRACSNDDTVACTTNAACPGGTCVTRTVLHETVVGGIPDGNPPRWRYRNVRAKDEGGIYSIKLLEKMEQRRCAGGPGDGGRCDINFQCPADAACLGYYLLKLKAYVDTNVPASDMETRVEVAGTRWSARGLWSPTKNGWRFGKKDTRLEPW
jgi:hypothetical protein